MFPERLPLTARRQRSRTRACCGADPGSVLDQIKVVLEAGGATMEDIAYNMIFISDVRHYQEMNKVYRNTSKNPPARYCIVSELVRDVLSSRSLRLRMSIEW